LKKLIQKNNKNGTYYKDKGKQKYEEKKSAKGGKYKSNDSVEHLPET
jgi:hypothetical protein